MELWIKIAVETEASLVLRETYDCTSKGKSSGQIFTKLYQNISLSTPVARLIFYIHTDNSAA